MSEADTIRELRAELKAVQRALAQRDDLIRELREKHADYVVESEKRLHEEHPLLKWLAGYSVHERSAGVMNAGLAERAEIRLTLSQGAGPLVTGKGPTLGAAVEAAFTELRVRRQKRIDVLRAQLEEMEASDE